MIDVNGYRNDFYDPRYDKRSEVVEKLAAQALEKPSDFGWWGREEMFETWGWAGVDKHRDSTILELSNFEIVYEDLKSKFPDDVEQVRIGHWAVGHCDRTIVRILIDPDNGILSDNITEAFKEAMDWHFYLLDYPVANDTHYSEMSYEASIEFIANHMPSMIGYEVSRTEAAVAMYEQLVYDMNVMIEMDDDYYPSDHDMIIAAYNLGFIDPDYREEWEEFVAENSLAAINWDEPNATHKVDPNQLKLPFE